MALVRLPDWHERLIAVANEYRLKSYVYGQSDCACFVQACVAAQTGVVLLSNEERPRGWIAAAKFMIARGWTDVEHMATCLLGPPADDPALSRVGDIVSFLTVEELHLAVRVGDTALSPASKGLMVVERNSWRSAWKIG